MYVYASTNKTAQPSKNTHQPQISKQMCTVRFEMWLSRQTPSERERERMNVLHTTENKTGMRKIKEETITENEMTNFYAVT